MLMMAAMRETQRRKLLHSAHKLAEEKLKAEAAKLLRLRYRALKRELRRANFRKRLRKTDGILQKNDGEWQRWIDEFSAAFQKALQDVVNLFTGVEGEYFTSHGGKPLTLDPQKVVLDYQDRIGRQITRIAEETLTQTQSKIADWYNTDEGLPDLIDDLGSLYGEDRAELIARTEAGFIRSQVALESMNFYGIGRWIWDSAMEARTCEFCASMHGKVFDISDAMPPDASHPDCLCGVVYANDDGSELIYGG